MNFYETMYIVHPILELGRLHDLILETEKIIKEKGGEVLYTKVIGKKRMAYPILKQKFGTYILVQYKSDGLKNNEFSLDMEHNPNILRQMIITINESEVKEQTEDVKEQITGLTRPSKNKLDDKNSESSKEEAVKVSTEDKKTDENSSEEPVSETAEAKEE
jgi:small subunit ribosomal protein S6